MGRERGDGVDRSCAGIGKGRAVIPCYLATVSSDSSDARCQRCQTKMRSGPLKGIEDLLDWQKSSPEAPIAVAPLTLESQVAADTGHFLTNLLARARQKFPASSFFLFLRERCRTPYVRPLSAGIFVRRAPAPTDVNHQLSGSHVLLPLQLGPACAVRQNARVVRVRPAKPLVERPADLPQRRANPCRRTDLPIPGFFARARL